MPRNCEFIDKAEFERLVGHLRLNNTELMYEEISWLATDDRRVVGLLIRDRFDHDFGWVLFVRHRCTYQTADVWHSFPSAAAALDAVQCRMKQPAGPA